MHDLTVYVKEGLLFTQDLSPENSLDSCLCFQLALPHPMCYFLSLYWSSSLSLCTVFDYISSNMDEVLSISPSANGFVFGDFSVHHKDWLTYSGGTDRLVNSVIIFLSQMLLLRWLTFLLGSQTVNLIVLLFWIYFFFLTLVYVPQWPSLHWEILIMWFSQFPLTFHQIHKCPFSLHSLWLWLILWVGSSWNWCIYPS